MRTTKIFVGSLSSRTRSSDLRALFQHYGRVTECDILSSFGFVHMENANDARNAIRALNGYKLDSVRITVVLSVSNGRSGAVGDRSRFRRSRKPMRGPAYPSRSAVGSRADPYSSSSRYRPSSVSKYDSREYYQDPYDRRAPVSSSSHRDLSPPSSRARERMMPSMRDRSPSSPPSGSRSHREPYGTRRDEYGRLVATSRGDEERYAATGQSSVDAREYRSRLPAQYYDDYDGHRDRRMPSDHEVSRSRHAEYDYPSQSRGGHYYSREGAAQRYTSSASSSSSPEPRGRGHVASRRDSSSSPPHRRSSVSPQRRRYASTDSSSSSSSSSVTPPPRQRRRHHAKTKRRARHSSSQSSSPKRMPSSRESSESPPRRRHRGRPPSPPTQESSPSPDPEPKPRRRRSTHDVSEVAPKKRRHHAASVHDHGDYAESDSPKRTVAPPPEHVANTSDSTSPKRRKKHKDRTKSRVSKKEKKMKKVANGNTAT